MAFSFQSSSFISLVIEGVLYGFSTCLFIASALIQTSGAFTGRAKLVLGCGTTLLFVLSTVHMIAHVFKSYKGFVTIQGPEQGAYLADSSDICSTIKALAYILESIVGDAILIYRCYRVWDNIWIVVPSMVTSCVAAALGFVTIVNTTRTNGTGWMEGSYASWVFAAYAFLLVTDLVPTCLLSYKLWKKRRSSARHVLIPLIHIILECGIIYSLSLITFMVVIAFSSYASYVVFNFMGQIAPITFYLILICVWVARPYESHAIAIDSDSLVDQTGSRFIAIKSVAFV